MGVPELSLRTARLAVGFAWIVLAVVLALVTSGGLRVFAAVMILAGLFMLRFWLRDPTPPPRDR
jgi:hypothetical protein